MTITDDFHFLHVVVFTSGHPWVRMGPYRPVYHFILFFFIGYIFMSFTLFYMILDGFIHVFKYFFHFSKHMLHIFDHTLGIVHGSFCTSSGPTNSAYYAHLTFQHLKNTRKSECITVSTSSCYVLGMSPVLSGAPAHASEEGLPRDPMTANGVSSDTIVINGLAVSQGTLELKCSP